MWFSNRKPGLGKVVNNKLRQLPGKQLCRVGKLLCSIEHLSQTRTKALFLLNYCFGFWLCDYSIDTSRLFIMYLPTDRCRFYLPLDDLSYFDRSIDAKVRWTSMREILLKIHLWFSIHEVLDLGLGNFNQPQHHLYLEPNFYKLVGFENKTPFHEKIFFLLWRYKGLSVIISSVMIAWDSKV